MSFGIGAFPFGLFASTINFNDGRPPARKYSNLMTCFVNIIECPGLTCGISMVKPRFVFEIVNLWSYILLINRYPYMLLNTWYRFCTTEVVYFCVQVGDFSIFELTCAYCAVGSYASLSVRLSVNLIKNHISLTIIARSTLRHSSNLLPGRKRYVKGSVANK